jgi:hypothetical protein
MLARGSIREEIMLQKKFRAIATTFASNSFTVKFQDIDWQPPIRYGCDDQVALPSLIRTWSESVWPEPFAFYYTHQY